MTKCDFCGNCTSKGECLGPEEMHRVGDDAVRYCSEAADRYLNLLLEIMKGH